MIQYSLKCSKGHKFDSWFQSASAYEKLARSGLISCAVCGGTEVEKAIMAPRVQSGSDAESGEARAAAATGGPLSAPASPAEQALRELRRKIEATADYVGTDFSREARAIHEGSAPERPIYGEAKAHEAAALVRDGVPVAPLPFALNRKTN